MTSGQTAFEAGKFKTTPLNLTAEDLKVMRNWKTVKAQCPWCLYTLDLWSFATFNYRKKKGKTVNEQKCRCPDCGAEIMRRTLLRIHEMTMDEFGLWFWDSVFTGGCYPKVQWDKLKARLKSGFTYMECEPFWRQYRQHKELSLRGWQDEEDFTDYLSTANPTLDEGPKEEDP